MVIEHTTQAAQWTPTTLTAHEISQLTPEAVYAALATRPDGLEPDEAVARLTHIGPNQYVPRQRWQRWQRWLSPLAVTIQPLLIPIWVAAVIAWSVGQLMTAYILLVAGIVNVLVGILQERKAGHAAAALRHALPTYAHVIRDGQQLHILTHHVVPGDVLLLSNGETIPADARVVEERDLRTINVALIGEAAATRKIPDAVSGDELLATELPNLVYAGGRVASGSARALVYTTGLRTAYGSIVALTESAHEEPSPLLWVFTKLGGVVVFVAAVAAVLGGLLAFVGRPMIDLPDALLLLVGLLVAATPVGLMPGITITLLEGWRRLSRHGARVRRLSSIETLGATTVICADKTGTLTQNEMTVREVWTVEGSLTVTGVGFDPAGTFMIDGKRLDHAALKRRADPLFRAAVLTSAAKLLPPDTLRPEWHILGEPVEAATVVAAWKAGYRTAKVQEAAPQLATLPATEKLPVEGCVVEEAKQHIAYLHGPPDAIVAHCTKIRTPDGERPFNEHDRATIRRMLHRYERGGMRTIAYARRRLPPETVYDSPSTAAVMDDLTLLGLMAVMDPPRQAVEQAIRTCHRAGIRTMMLTGDYTLPAESLARRCALVESARATTITGIELSSMDDATLRERLRVGDIVFARMTPEHKVRVVEMLDAMGEVVLVTGGAANDVPALKAADIGIAMGTSSSLAARDAADVILRDDNFATISLAIAEGRAVEQRARRLVALNLAVTMVKLVAYATGLLAGWPLLLSVGQLLLLDLLGGFVPAIALGAGPPDPSLMLRQPRRSGRALINSRIYRLGYTWFGLLGAGAALLGAWLGALWSGLPFGRSSAASFAERIGDLDFLPIETAYIAFGIAALLGAGLRLRSSSQRYPFGRALVAIVVTAVVATLVVLIRLPAFQSFVRLSPLPLWLWALALVIMILAALIEWGRQQVDLPQVSVKREE